MLAKRFYYMVTMVNVCSDWLFSCNDWALLAGCSGHIQAVFNLIVDILLNIHVMVSCQKGYLLTSVT